MSDHHFLYLHAYVWIVNMSVKICASGSLSMQILMEVMRMYLRRKYSGSVAT